MIMKMQKQKQTFEENQEVVCPLKMCFFRLLKTRFW